MIKSEWVLKLNKTSQIVLVFFLSLSASYAEIEKPVTEILSIQERQYLKQKKQLKMCVDPDWMPYEKIENGKHTGMSADFLRLVAKKINTPIILVQTDSWLQSLQFGLERRCDLFSSIMPTPKRSLFLDFSKPYMSFPLVVATGFDKTFFNDISQIIDKPLGIQKGYAYVELLRLQYPEINLVEVDSLKQGLDKVIDRELFGMIATLPGVAYEFQKHKISDLMISGKLAQQWSLGIGTRNDEPLLINIINKAIFQVSEQQHRAITGQWMTINQEQKVDYTLLIQVASVIILFFCFFLYHLFQLKKYNKKLEYLSATDALTQVSNRIKLDQQLAKNIGLANRYQLPFSIILLDVDHFKKINDQYGHLVGDYALQTLAQLLQHNVRSVDTFGRWGGEEFLIICPELTLEQCVQMAEKLRDIVDQFNFEHFSSLTCSFGLSSFKNGDSSNNMIKRADEALFKAKNRGRNHVCIDS